MTSNPVVCFILKGKERMGEEAPDSQGGGAGEVPFTVGSGPLSSHTPRKDYTVDLLPGAPFSAGVCLGGGVRVGSYMCSCMHGLKPEVNIRCFHFTF